MKTETPHETAKRIAQHWFPKQPTKQQLALADIAAALNAERERAAKTPKCVKCGYVMCQQFDSRPVNAIADIATPNGKYVCYHCTPAPLQPEGEQEQAKR